MKSLSHVKTVRWVRDPWEKRNLLLEEKRAKKAEILRLTNIFTRKIHQTIHWRLDHEN